MARPSLDSIGNWLEGRLTKFIAGDEATPVANEGVAVKEQKSFAGPFTHYSTITSTAPSTSSSPQPTVINPYSLPGTQSNVPKRSGSAQATRATRNPQIHIDRASSAMEYRPFPRQTSPVPRIASANAATVTFGQAAYNSHVNAYGHMNGRNAMPDISDVSESTSSDADQSETDRFAASPGLSGAGAWWGSTYSEESSATTPTASTFHQLEESESTSGFISLMDDPTLSATAPAPPPTASTTASSLVIREEDEEDLGLGNSSRRPTPASGDPKPEETRSSDDVSGKDKAANSAGMNHTQCFLNVSC